MKDLAHHLKKLNRRIIRSTHREEMEEEDWEMNHTSPYAWKLTKAQEKKQEKAKQTQRRKTRPATPLTLDEKNKKMRKRVPVFDRQNKAKPKPGARRTSKKTPRI